MFTQITNRYHVPTRWSVHSGTSRIENVLVVRFRNTARHGGGWYRLALATATAITFGSRYAIKTWVFLFDWFIWNVLHVVFKANACGRFT